MTRRGAGATHGMKHRRGVRHGVVGHGGTLGRRIGRDSWSVAPPLLSPLLHPPTHPPNTITRPSCTKISGLKFTVLMAFWHLAGDYNGRVACGVTTTAAVWLQQPGPGVGAAGKEAPQKLQMSPTAHSTTYQTDTCTPTIATRERVGTAFRATAKTHKHSHHTSSSKRVRRATSFRRAKVSSCALVP